MSSLATLRTVNFVLAGFTILASLFIAAMASSTTGEGPLLLAAGVGFIAGVLYIITGNRVAEGEGRVMQTIMAVLAASSIPIGTAYCAYAIYVCWINDESKACFK